MFKIYISDSIYDRNVSNEGQLATGRNNLNRLLKQQPVKILSEAQTNDLLSHPEQVLKNPSSLYILNTSQVQALAIQRRYGVMCMSGDSIDLSPLIDINDVHVCSERQKLGQGWDTVLDSVETLPSNALLLSDRYLFAFRHPNAGDGIANIKSILQELLPCQFDGGDYHVTVVFDNMAKHSSYTFNEIVTQLNKIKQMLGRDYPILMEVLGITPDCPLYNKLHNRMIISNYYMVEAGHRLAAFNKNVGTTRQMLLPLALFTESSLSGASTPPLNAITQTLNTLNNFSKALPDRPWHGDYFYAVNGRRMEKCLSIKSRLLN